MPRNDPESLRLREERLHIALSASATGTFCWDPASGFFVEFDENLRQLVGAAAAPVEIGEFLELVHPEDGPKLLAALTACREGTDFEMEFRAGGGEARPRWLFGRAKMMRQAGRTPYLVGACTDITHRKQTEAALRQSEKLGEAGRLAASIAHEINNPLAAITNLLWLAQQDQALSSRTRGYLDAAGEELGRVAQITKQSLGFYRDHSEPRPVVVAEMVTALLGVFAGRIRSRNVRVVSEARSGRAVVALEGELRQIVSNLLANSLDAVAEEGTIRIRLTRARGWKGTWNEGLRITVADNGMGIAPADLARVFDPFFSTKKETGTGLGLWVVRQVVERYGGLLQIRSQPAAGAGRPGWTAVSICLPSRVPAAEAA